MNLLHLKYAVEVSKTASITKAAEKLYISQPNLSRAIKELEEALGIEIFKRSPKGIYPTARGEEFLGYAKKILAQVDSVERLYKGEREVKKRFSVSVPRASYISHAFTEFVKQVSDQTPTEFFYKETNSMRVISNILNADYDLGVLRYQTIYESKFADYLAQKGLTGDLIREFDYLVLASADHPLVKSGVQISLDSLAGYTEIAHGDPYVPSIPTSSILKNELFPETDKRIFVFERASQFELLSAVPGTFMWVSPVPADLLSRYNLVQIPCPANKRRCKDILIYNKEYRFSELDKLFIEQLKKAAAE